MSLFEIKERIESIVIELNEHNYRYYVLAQPTLSDFEYDKKLEELARLEKEYTEYLDPESPTIKVGGYITKEFETVKHKWPMLSLGNTYNEQDLKDFDERVRKVIGDDFEYVCELKFDGLSISLSYENGKLIRAITRGDGTQGDDVTHNVKTIRSIPKTIKALGHPESFDIRGEIFMHRAAFEKLNNERIENNENAFANPRNFASGTLKMQDSTLHQSRPLQILSQLEF